MSNVDAFAPYSEEVEAALAKQGYESAREEIVSFPDKTCIRGTFLGAGPNPKIKGEIRTTWRFRTDDGEDLCVWGAAALDNQLVNMAEGTKVVVARNGQKELENGRRVNVYDVKVMKKS